MKLPMIWEVLTHPPPPAQNGRDFADDIFQRILLNENIICWMNL